MQIHKIAKTVSLAIDEALQDLDTTIDKIEFEVLQEPSSGFFGIGRKPAKVLIKLIEPEKPEIKPEIKETKIKTKEEPNVEIVKKSKLNIESKKEVVEKVIEKPKVAEKIIEKVIGKTIEETKIVEEPKVEETTENINFINTSNLEEVEEDTPTLKLEQTASINNRDDFGIDTNEIPISTSINTSINTCIDTCIDTSNSDNSNSDNSSIVSDDVVELTLKPLDDKPPEKRIPKMVSYGSSISKKPVNTEACNTATKFLLEIFEKMDLNIDVNATLDDKNDLFIDLKGENVGIAIGKRGQTLDSLQYLVNLVINKGAFAYVSVTIDTEQYRERRKQTLETLAVNLSKKAKKIGKNVNIEPMNPYERRVIHAKLQNDKTIKTYSVGEEPFRYVVIAPKQIKKPRNNNSNNSNKNFRQNNSENKTLLPSLPSENEKFEKEKNSKLSNSKLGNSKLGESCKSEKISNVNVDK